MGKNQDEKPVVGTVTETLPNLLFRVKLSPDERETLAYLGGKMRLHRIKVLVGDTVELVMAPDGGRGRIVRRM
ncbi:MAG: translation initiation factor IF-1 [Candidatus Pacebacteria bacterium]|nr:translation initiation factor IF-1 [Candidatus Paceibacterota bacterium]